MNVTPQSASKNSHTFQMLDSLFFLFDFDEHFVVIIYSSKIK